MKRLFAPLLLIFTLTGCGTAAVMPQTGPERLRVAIAAYESLELTIQDGVLQGHIKGQQAVEVKTAKNAAKAALDAWVLLPNDPSAETAWILALKGAQVLLRGTRAVGGSP